MTTITISQHGVRYLARFPFSYATKDLVKAAGFKFDAGARVWWTDVKPLGDALIGSWTHDEFTAIVNNYRDQAHAAAQASIDASRASSSKAGGGKMSGPRAGPPRVRTMRSNSSNASRTSGNTTTSSRNISGDCAP